MKGDLIERDDILKILYEIKDNDEIPKNYGTILDIIRRVRVIPAKINVNEICQKVCDKYHETCFMVECEGNCEFCGHQIFKDYVIDTLKGVKNGRQRSKTDSGNIESIF